MKGKTSLLFFFLRVVRSMKNKNNIISPFWGVLKNAHCWVLVRLNTFKNKRLIARLLRKWRHLKKMLIQMFFHVCWKMLTSCWNEDILICFSDPYRYPPSPLVWKCNFFPLYYFSSLNLLFFREVKKSLIVGG